jgi:hypothetical protein
MIFNMKQAELLDMSPILREHLFWDRSVGGVCSQGLDDLEGKIFHPLPHNSFPVNCSLESDLRKAELYS